VEEEENEEAKEEEEEDEGSFQVARSRFDMGSSLYWKQLFLLFLV